MANTSIARGQDWLKTLLQKAGLSVEIQGESEQNTFADGEGYWLTIDENNLTPEQIKILIGVDGSVLDAMQYLANSILNIHQPPEGQASYTIELNGYRFQRQGQIQALAESAAQQVRATGQEVEIKSLSSAERRQVHSFLESLSDLESFSRGKEPHRHLVVRPAGIE
ncbi:protein jag [Calothrix sp. UHCC 0171]|uniref:Jag family protein n=1 Tax=Calothrix sp. UHCC 0171 TaxID=3110245 RepID=UPI002B2089DA|nr:R3H domain-containing nucleic acid-binding protein [Calothrix sp. UHCC 0171]MEA5571485.1 R3H domain-containing nucleic acid-binding protein [Calothrix sp. UHCC 0171]